MEIFKDERAARKVVRFVRHAPQSGACCCYHDAVCLSVPADLDSGRQLEEWSARRSLYPMCERRHLQERSGAGPADLGRISGGWWCIPVISELGDSQLFWEFQDGNDQFKLGHKLCTLKHVSLNCVSLKRQFSVSKFQGRDLESSQTELGIPSTLILPVSLWCSHSRLEWGGASQNSLIPRTTLDSEFGDKWKVL